MESIFNDGDAQSIEEMLASRDERVAYQNKIVAENPHKTLLAIKLNIPGPIKNNQKIDQLFSTGLKKFLNELEINDFRFSLLKQTAKPSGSEAFLLVENDIKKTKLEAIHFEDEDPLGRLFDIDVLGNDQQAALSRVSLNLPVRKCFICSRPAKDCARSRRHSVAELQDKISQLYYLELENK
ncbi:citrate lyase holo-[acyl-carrier protein] synthase [Secundilactobacillus malefermentans]|uniref:citrate lyase holo-[acyl-carrier protein] synthase n=1 Tax=Secundilactobacillus malefermentans TaxID=176292 RepID=A0A4V3A4C1_9LACO|nr:citrate lyase holo-[acyl-carrier protein] synthase [Secundilactobacillus malefermentans]KRM58059.1 apo-citrate lyase phosphoribosyl-ft dephospho-CoA transferase [Secundilactobacillus malefermentans DSM 5705 = KCTC 3548]QEA31344.1 citrate lyase holo-[acyl-carrier protein] synthase [Secundilactobacillus malefermentans]TDG80203.1 hypothetical protein C5L31_001813 [Secundilactobacillus malefermentans]